MTEIKNPSIIDFSDIDDDQMNALIDGTLTDFDEGDLVDGTVVKIEHDEVLVDIGFKSEGVIPLRELSIRKDADPSDIVNLGDKIEALVLQKEDKDGYFTYGASAAPQPSSDSAAAASDDGALSDDEPDEEDFARI